MWGAAPLPGREKFSLHPRHVRWTCQLNDAVESSGYALTYSGLPVARLSRVLFSVAVEGLSLRACTLCSPFSGAQSAPFLHPRHVCDVPKDDLKRPQEIQEIQEMQERPYGAKVKTLCRTLLWSTYLAVFVNLRGPS